MSGHLYTPNNFLRVYTYYEIKQPLTPENQNTILQILTREGLEKSIEKTPKSKNVRYGLKDTNANILCFVVYEHLEGLRETFRIYLKTAKVADLTCCYNSVLKTENPKDAHQNKSVKRILSTYNAIKLYQAQEK